MSDCRFVCICISQCECVWSAMLVGEPVHWKFAKSECVCVCESVWVGVRTITLGYRDAAKLFVGCCSISHIPSVVPHRGSTNCSLVKSKTVSRFEEQDLTRMAWSGFPTFTAVEDAEVWLQEYGLFLLESGLSREEGVAHAFPLLVRGKAKGESLQAEEKQDWSTLEAAFRSRYVVNTQWSEVK
ncbi:hypothetical protein GOP47_0004596 [Adiantum capillus-veneris]|uniref:Uncharacterized protein n=1 Tax=Adiantum capillus-veneris TaxID=13818 RepID=A0A9D4ZMS0_ADICA|nr:hypothetical protein GOP47_0004596 [Adiantum capillus-veneris]